MTKYHYTYRITNMVDHKHYYGARSSEVHPTQDLGIKYFSNSSDKEFMAEQKLNPDNFKYKIIKIFETREEAIALEIKLHAKFNVGVNESFYNKAKQTSIGFDTTGTQIIFSNERNKKISDKLKGRKRTKEEKLLISKRTKECMVDFSFSEEQKLKQLMNLKNFYKNQKENNIPHHSSIKCSGENNHFYGKHHSPESRKKISDSNTGRVPWNKGISPEIFLCEYCKKEICGKGNYIRWHNKNCKNYKEIEEN